RRRRHTRCLSDWSSDVCSSDLSSRPRPSVPPQPLRQARVQPPRLVSPVTISGIPPLPLLLHRTGRLLGSRQFGIEGSKRTNGARSEERSVGKESRNQDGDDRKD